MPMPWPITEILRPLYVPVKPYILRTLQTSFTSCRKVSAMNLARNGSPGIRTTSAKSPISALICGVAICSLLKFVECLIHYGRGCDAFSIKPHHTAVRLQKRFAVIHCRGTEVARQALADIGKGVATA